MPFKTKEQRNIYQKQYFIDNPDKYEKHKKQCRNKIREERKKSEKK